MSLCDKHGHSWKRLLWWTARIQVCRDCSSIRFEIHGPRGVVDKSHRWWFEPSGESYWGPK